jgi:hypothetical protein
MKFRRVVEDIFGPFGHVNSTQAWTRFCSWKKIHEGSTNPDHYRAYFEIFMDLEKTLMHVVRASVPKTSDYEPTGAVGKIVQ